MVKSNARLTLWMAFVVIVTLWLTACSSIHEKIPYKESLNVSKATVSDKEETLSLEDRIVQTARSYLGVQYKWGGTSARRGFDCSGFTLRVFKEFGITLPRSSYSQFQVGEAVEKTHLKKGDLVFFSTGFRNRISHVGIYCGQGRFIHASTSKKCIRMADMSNKYYRKRYCGARRVTHL